MTERTFWRETNIWRLVGLIIALSGVLLAIAFPEVTVYENHGIKVNLGVVVMLLGFLGFYPTLREAIGKKVSK
jgi:uncharacterized membrane protein YqaE (UPF0057 family)